MRKIVLFIVAFWITLTFVSLSHAKTEVIEEGSFKTEKGNIHTFYAILCINGYKWIYTNEGGRFGTMNQMYDKSSGSSFPAQPSKCKEEVNGK